MRTTGGFAMRYYFFGGFSPKLEGSVPMTSTHASHLRIRALCEGAIMVALAQALSHVSHCVLLSSLGAGSGLAGGLCVRLAAADF